MIESRIRKEIIDVLSDPNKPKLNLGCGLDIQPTELGWVNVDSIQHEKILQVDIFRLPFPFDDNTFDLVLAKQVLEHVPHNVPSYGYKANFLQLLVEEIWRIMKPGGLFHIEVPPGLNSLVDAIDHKRIITPYTFHVFFPDDPWNFYSKCRFELVSGKENVTRSYRALHRLLRKFFCVDIEPLRVRPASFDLRKLPMDVVG